MSTIGAATSRRTGSLTTETESFVAAQLPVARAETSLGRRSDKSRSIRERMTRAIAPAEFSVGASGVRLRAAGRMCARSIAEQPHETLLIPVPRAHRGRRSMHLSIDSQYDALITQRGRRILRSETTMRTFNVVVERDPDTGLFVGHVPGWPGAHSQGESLDELQRNLQEVVSMLLEDGEPKLESEFVAVQTIKVA